MLHNATLCYLFMLLLLFWRALCVSVTDCGSGIMPRIYTMYPSRRRSRPKCSLSCWEGFIKYSNG